ncbi:nucleoside-diphosphate-sugar epimerase [Singulisphaera acidiphila DSM 18658]|uniref:Nucleoside-diphosphate-sugar epimerase n=1 Tax=Singulisphaera acidiphila (strain ATCC BAA-1392 / DSM 18658 / VKM B-2454 / MOB10) TaxID=886293 RepID=L0DK54_SINAD|nr:NAD-dependent epimerase/dehydratase family protein [Singulisphaera acidiphila]AGA29637.1 nucleoside-diphosphate-sugar epimerase [Singulisphaera acidiphila DSM 18658]
MKVLIIGGTNFIGPPLVRRLVGLGHEVAVFHQGQTQADLPLGVEHVLGNRHHLGAHADEFRRFGPEVVVDMIAYIEADAAGLVETFRGLARRTVVVSSADVYRAYGRFIGTEDGPVEPTPLTEESPLRTDLFPYRSHAQGPDDFFHTYDKIPVEQVVINEPDLPGTVLRLPMVHGPGDPYRRLSAYLKRMDDGRPAIVLDEAMARWKCPRGYVENVAAAITLAVVDERATGRTYNVADPVAFDEAEWVRRLGGVVGWRGRVETVPGDRISLPYRMGQGIDMNSDRIRRELGYAEPVPPGEALEQTINWERANPPTTVQSFGLLGYEAEDELLAGSGPGLLVGQCKPGEEPVEFLRTTVETINGMVGSQFLDPQRIAHGLDPPSNGPGSWNNRESRGNSRGGASRAVRNACQRSASSPNRVRLASVSPARSNALSSTNSLTERWATCAAAWSVSFASGESRKSSFALRTDRSDMV